MFADPITIHLGSSDINLPRVSSEGTSARYESADGLTVVKASHIRAKRVRRQFRVDLRKVTSDPFIPAQNVEVSSSCFVIFDSPVAGFSASEMADAYKGLTGTLNASSYALLNKFLAGES